MTVPINLLSEGRKALITQLQTISVDNGYRTTAGFNVKSGWLNEVIKASGVGFPLIVVQKAKGRVPEPGAGGCKMYPGYNVIGAVDVGLDNYEDALDDLELDLVRCLMPLHGRATDWTPRGIPTLSFGAPEQFPPGDGLSAATVLIPVYLHTLIE
ncbi:hypothetical protein [Pseudomonas sp.]|uniref:hypothetical protein n=1 Tax=Pseudomonas sp. TaxID=306 RepID=UPI00272F32E6|nr:hypothetical protein [Pseudomonas sp.]MDP2244018.1 hypothetical protein [Pseudomonas sp.]